MSPKPMTVGEWLAGFNHSALIEIECDGRIYPVLNVSQGADVNSPLRLVAATPLEQKYQALLRCNATNATKRVDEAVERGEITLPVRSVEDARRLAHISTFGAVDYREEGS